MPKYFSVTSLRPWAIAKPATMITRVSMIENGVTCTPKRSMVLGSPKIDVELLDKFSAAKTAHNLLSRLCMCFWMRSISREWVVTARAELSIAKWQ